jgi:hypothetical protein
MLTRWGNPELHELFENERQALLRSNHAKFLARTQKQADIRELKQLKIDHPELF